MKKTNITIEKVEVEIEEEQVMFNEEHDKLVEEILEEDNISLPEVDQS